MFICSARLTFDFVSSRRWFYHRFDFYVGEWMFLYHTNTFLIWCLRKISSSTLGSMAVPQTTWNLWAKHLMWRVDTHFSPRFGWNFVLLAISFSCEKCGQKSTCSDTLLLCSNCHVAFWNTDHQRSSKKRNSYGTWSVMSFTKGSLKVRALEKKRRVQIRKVTFTLLWRMWEIPLWHLGLNDLCSRKSLLMTIVKFTNML